MKKPVIIVLIVLSIIAFDQITKYLIINALSPYETIRISSFLNIVNVTNTGAAFGMFRDLSRGFFIVISMLAIFFVIYLLIKGHYNFFGLSLVLGGAIGNVIDRIRFGKVVDFIDFSVGNFHWPAFNVADSALTVGVILVFLFALFKK